MSKVTVLRLGTVDYRWALRLQERLVEARRQDVVGDLLLVVQHPPVITFGRGGGAEDLRVSQAALQRLGVDLVQTDRGGRATYHGPGQLVVYPILKLGSPAHPYDPHTYLWRLEESAIACLNQFNIAAGRQEHHPGVWVGENKIAAVGIALAPASANGGSWRGVTYHGLALNVAPSLEHFQLITPCGLADKGVTSMAQVLGQPPALAAVEAAYLEAFAQVFQVALEFGFQQAPWLIARAPVGEKVEHLAGLFQGLRLHTVCEEALCPNIGECWGGGTATFMLLGDICTRHCRFCAVTPGRPLPPDPLEPDRLAEAAARMGLRHVVITAVARDDLPDGGAAHFATTIAAVRRRCPGVTVEVLIPDFGGSVAALQQVIAARPDVLNHNIETVPRLYPLIQPRKDYRRALSVLAWARRAGLTTKAGLILGMGETRGEVIQVMKDLRRAGCELLTLGQYLQPTARHWPVVEYIHPVEFAWYREVGLALGFQAVAAGPLVRSSYQAGQLFARRLPVYSEEALA
jgi:lipoic acid synthetase